MKFNYEFRTKDNVVQRGCLAASDRDAAYAQLKSRGIKPSRVTEAPGFFNKLFGKGKRWIAIVVLSSAVVFGLVSRWITERPEYSSHADEFITSRMRRQIIGDVAEIEKGVSTGWAQVFTHEGERFLASFAVPGIPAAIKSTSAKFLAEALERPSPALLPDASIEARQIVSIVDGMKSEIRSLVESGWSLADVGKALARRQDQEIGYYRSAREDVERMQKSGATEAEVVTLWESRNKSLRRLGIRPVPMPKWGEE